MSLKKNKELFEAVCFFGKKSIIKEMRYSEFEAVLDGVVGIPELANKEVQAAYVKINQALQVHSLVTFQVEFNDRGFADEDWNIPLRHLADNAGPGPNLGAGPIRLACRSQCSVSWYQRELWEPNQREINHFTLLQEAIARNKLGLITADDDFPTLQVPPVVNQQELPPVLDVPLVSEAVPTRAMVPDSSQIKAEYESKLVERASEYQQKVDMLVQTQKQTLQAMEEKYRDEIDQVKRAMRNEAQTVRHHAQDLEQQANQNKVLFEKLQSRNIRLERDHTQLSERAESVTDQYAQLKDEYLELLRNQRSEDDELSSKINDLKEQLTEKSVEFEELSEENTRLLVSNTQLTERLEGYEDQARSSADSNSEALNEHRAELQVKRDEVAHLKAKVTSLDEEKKRLQHQYEAAQQKLEQLNKRLEQITGERDALAIEQTADRTQLKKYEFKLQEFQNSIREARTENDKLKQELSEAEAVEDKSSELYERMEKFELVFVAYHPGAGHISLPARQLEDYLDKPLMFAAQKCGVTLEHYKSWMLHYDTAECEECGVPVKRIDTPSDYQPGINNRCSKHRLQGENITVFRKSS